MMMVLVRLTTMEMTMIMILTLSASVWRAVVLALFTYSAQFAS